MDGVEGVVDAVMGRLKAGLPGKLAALRTRYSVVDGSLPDITRFLAHEPDDVGIDKPPMIVVVESESDILQGPTRVSADGGGGATYAWRYTLGIYAWAAGRTFDATALTRKRYGLAVREILLETPGLGPVDPGSMVLDPGSIIETYSSIARDGASREVLAATALIVKYETQEFLPARRPGLPAAVVAGAVAP